jgi:hypothetical protein
MGRRSVFSSSFRTATCAFHAQHQEPNNIVLGYSKIQSNIASNRTFASSSPSLSQHYTGLRNSSNPEEDIMGAPKESKNKWRITPTVKDASGAPRNARAIVVLIGWWGAKPQHLNKYGDMYQELLPSAAIVTGTASTLSILLKHDDQLRDFARKGLEAIASVLADYENLHVPVLVHVFSNGGGFVWHHMMDILETQEDAALMQFQHHLPINLSMSTIDTEETPLHANTALSLMRKNIRGLIFDSSPAYPKIDNGIAALEGSGMVGNRLLMGLLKCIFVLFYVLESLWDRINNRPHRLMQYWKGLIECDWDVPQGFIYSSVDRMVDPDHLEEFIQARKTALLRHDKLDGISVLKFDDSPHVLHYKYHPEEYTEFVDGFLQRNIVRAASKLRR